jgi:hypothetical protein
MLKYLHNSNFKIALDLNPFMWTIRFIAGGMSYNRFLYIRLLFISVMIIIDDGINETITEAFQTEKTDKEL